MATLYELLGVAQDASPAELRTAYLAKARELHPDHHGSGSTAEVAQVQRRMQEVNAAWSVLNDPRARREYDETLRPAEPVFTSQPPVRGVPWEPVEVRDAPNEPASLLVHLVRIGPVVVLLGVLGAIFVFTAFATGGRSVDLPIPRSDRPAQGACVDVGTTITTVPCGGTNSGVVDSVEFGTGAEDDCVRRDLVPLRWDRSTVLCIRPPD